MQNYLEVFDTSKPDGVPEWRLYISGICLTLGSLGLLLGVFAASTNLFMMVLNWSVEQSWQFAGLVGGLGAHLLIASIPYATPRVSDWSLKVIEIGGAFVLLALCIFAYQYPSVWNIFRWDSVALVSIIYLIGMSCSITAALRSVVRFKVQQVPGGKAKLVFEHNGDQVEATVEASTLRDEPHYALKSAVEDVGEVGSIGLIGGLPDTYYETQTNRPENGPNDTIVSDD